MSDGLADGVRALSVCIESARLWLVEARRELEKLREGVMHSESDTPAPSLPGPPPVV